MKKECETLINTCAERASQPLREAPWYLDDKTLADPDRVQKAPSVISSQMKKFLEVCGIEVRTWVGKVRVYLEDSRTVGILLAPMQANLVSRYEAFRTSMNVDDGQESVISTSDLWDLLRSWSEE